MKSLGKSDLEVFIQGLAAQRDPGGEHGWAHQTDCFSVHEEAVHVWNGERVRHTGPLHPKAHLHINYISAANSQVYLDHKATFSVGSVCQYRPVHGTSCAGRPATPAPEFCLLSPLPGSVGTSQPRIIYPFKLSLVFLRNA